MSTRRKVLVLGSTGSIGTQALDVCAKHACELEVVGLAAGKRVQAVLEQARKFEVHCTAIADGEACRSSAADELRELASRHDGNNAFFGEGEEGVLRLIQECDADVVVNSLVGAQGLRASYETLRLGKVLALANKESLVVGGDLIMPMAHKADETYPDMGTDAEFRPRGRLMPIDSEHGAIYQCLLGENMAEVERLWVTASGGPFRGMKRDDLRRVSAKDALAHPTWNMGPKITIDSSTLMNKGLEVIEAHHLFGAPYDRIEVVVQPQSAIHSMVEFADGSVKAHLGTTDMRIPIQFALSYPERWETPVQRMDFRRMRSLEFTEPDIETFRCLQLAKDAGGIGGTMPAAMNAANEVAVARFLAGECAWLDIPACIEHVMNLHDAHPVESVDQLVEVDLEARRLADGYVASL